MAWSWDGISVVVEVAFADDPLATTPTYTDVSAYVREVPSIFRGTTSEDAGVAPGRAVIVLDNRDRRFDPDYSSSSYAPNVLPMRRIRVSVEKGAFSAGQFTGFVTSWQNDWTVDGDGISVVSCIDGSWWLANETLVPYAYYDAVLSASPDYYWPDPTEADVVGDELLDADSQDDPIETAVAFPRGHGLAWAGLDREWGNADSLVAPPRALEFWARFGTGDGGVFVHVDYGSDDYLRIAADSDVLTVSYSNTSTNRYYDPGGFEQQYWNGNVTSSGMYHVAVFADTSSIHAYLNGQLAWSAAVSVGTNTEVREYPSVALGNSASAEASTSGLLSNIAIYSTAPSLATFQEHHLVGIYAYGHPYGETSGERIERVLDEIDWPAGLRAVDTGTKIQDRYLPAGITAMQYLDYVAASERGAMFMGVDGDVTFRALASMVGSGSAGTGVVFSDDGAAGAVTYESLRMDPMTIDTVRNVVTVSYSTVGGITRRDATSIASYGPSQLFIDGPTIPKARVASALAEFELDQRKDPASRVSSIRCGIRTSNATQTTTQVENLLDLELYDIVTVEVTPMGLGSQVVKTVQVLGIEHQIYRDQWYVTLYLSPAFDQSGWFTVGTSSLGGAHVLLP